MTTKEQAAPGRHSGVSGSDRRTLDALFAHPISHNLAWLDVVALIRRIGSVEERSDKVFVLRIGNEALDAHKPHTKQLTAPQVIDLRHFMERAGWRPESRGEPDALSGDPDSNLPGPPAPSAFSVSFFCRASVRRKR